MGEGDDEPGFIELAFEELSPEDMLERAREFHAQMSQRRTTRHFSDREVPRELIELAVRTASTAPSGERPFSLSINSVLVSSGPHSGSSRSTYPRTMPLLSSYSSWARSAGYGPASNSRSSSVSACFLASSRGVGPGGGTGAGAARSASHSRVVVTTPPPMTVEKTRRSAMEGQLQLKPTTSSGPLGDIPATTSSAE